MCRDYGRRIMTAAGRVKKHIIVWLITTALCLCGWVATDARAAQEDGLQVEQVYLREILRSYAADPTTFDAENSAQALADLFTATVGLNYYGEGNPASYFAKDITGKYDQAPYVAENLLGSYEVAIHPVNGRADVTTGGQTWKIHVYLTGYTAESVGAVPVYHYVWQDNGSWWAVRDDVPYYRVSYNGMSAAAARSAGVCLAWTRSEDVGVANGSNWVDLTTESDAAVASGSAATYVAVQGQPAIFAALDSAGNTLAISEYVRGSGLTGPVLRSRTIQRMDGSVLSPGEEMIPGETYRVRLVYREGLRKAQGNSVASVAAACGSVSDVVWYGADEYLPQDAYNPEAVEFTVTPGSNCDWCLFTLQGVVGFETGLAPAVFRCNTQQANAPAPAPTEVPAPVATAEPATEPVAVPTAEPIAQPVEAPAVEPVQEPTPAPTPDVIDFAPDALVTWGDLALRLWDAQGRPEVVNDPNQTNSYRASCWASSVGLLANWGDGSLTPELALTREQMSCILYAYAAYLGRDMSAADDLAARPDGATVRPWTVPYVQWAVGSGVLGTAMDGSVAPGATVSHSQLDWMLSMIL